MAEIELKLAASPDDLPRVKSALLAMAGGARASHSILNSTYYDTSCLTLKQHELMLRVRKQGRRFIQTVKAQTGNGAAALVRDEWEDAISGERPDLHAPTSGVRLQTAVNGDDLHPLFTTPLRRTVVMLEPRMSTRIEAAIDEGEIRAAAGDAAEPISEIELELKSGDPAVLYDIALRLLDVAPLRIEVRSKPERGYRLVEGAGSKPPVLHAEPPTLRAGMTVEAALQAIGGQCLTHLLRNEPAALADVPDGVHQMRVAVRRLRSALSTLKPMLPVEHHRWANDELRWLAGALGPARNWDVFVESLVRPVGTALPAEPDLTNLAMAAEQRRQAAYERAKEAIQSPRHTAAVLKLSRWFLVRGWRDQPLSEEAASLLTPVGHIAPQLIERRHKQVRKRSRHFAKLLPEQRHRVRIALKKLRYTIEFLQSLFDADEVAAFVAKLKPLQDDLGHANDVRSAHELLSELRNVDGDAALARAGGVVLGWHSRGLADAEPKLRRHVRRVRRAKPFW